MYDSKGICSKENQIEISGIKDFDPDHIFDCGQCFRFEKQADGSYTGIAFGKIVDVAFEPGNKLDGEGTLILKNTNRRDFENIWSEYLDLQRDYGQIKRTLAERDPILKDAIKYGSGIRILKQDPWETVLSFIISQNNNIPRIKKCINSLAQNFGSYAGTYQGRKYYNLPGWQTLAKLAPCDLSVCRLGYRAGYLIDTAKMISVDDGEKLNQMCRAEVSAEEAFSYVTSLCGVGPKVANCILLFSMGKYDSFPIDVWVRKVMNRLYGIEEKDTKTMAAFAKNTYGEWGGIAQQYLFYYMRSRPE